MSRLDDDERIAREPAALRRLAPNEIVDYARSLPRLWADAGPNGPQALVRALLARLDVLGYQRLEHELTGDAIDLGLDVVLPPMITREQDRRVWSGREDLNLRLHRPERCALPGCATPRPKVLF
jgi:hypothetical protein